MTKYLRNTSYVMTEMDSHFVQHITSVGALLSLFKIYFWLLPFSQSFLKVSTS